MCIRDRSKTVASYISPNISTCNLSPTFEQSGLTIARAIDLSNLKPNSPPVALPTTFQSLKIGLFPSTSASLVLWISKVTNLLSKPFSLHLLSASNPIKFPLFG